MAQLNRTVRAPKAPRMITPPTFSWGWARTRTRSTTLSPWIMPLLLHVTTTILNQDPNMNAITIISTANFDRLHGTSEHDRSGNARGVRRTHPALFNISSSILYPTSTEQTYPIQNSLCTLTIISQEVSYTWIQRSSSPPSVTPSTSLMSVLYMQNYGLS